MSEFRNMAFEDVIDALSQQRDGFMDAAPLPSRDDSLANTSDSDNESWSSGSDNTTSESDSSKRTTVATFRITFDFGVSNMGRMCIAAMVTHALYFLKG
jgi:hypothetical protein